MILLLGHHLFDHANNGQQHTAANTARGNLTDNRTDIHATGSIASHFGHSASPQHAQNFTAQTATDNTGDGIAQSAKAKIFHQSTSDITANRARYQANNQFNHWG